MAAPLTVSFVMRAAFSLVDTAFAATLGDHAVAAVGLTLPFEFLMIAVWVGLSTGLTSCLSRAMAAQQDRKISQYLRAAWVLVGWVSPAFLIAGIGIYFAAPHMALAPEVARSFAVYGAVLVGGSAFTTFWSVIPDSVVKAHQDTRSTMWAGIWSNVINLVLNTVFTFAFHWGVFGIALSTVIGRIGGLLYALARARFHEERRKASASVSACEPDPAPYAAILALAIPSALTFALTATETGIANALLARLPNATEAIAAYSIFYRVMLFAMNPVIAVGVAMLPYAARRFGEHDLAGLRRGLRESIVVSAGYTLALVAPVLLFGAPWIARALAESQITRDLATFALRVVPLACLAGAPFLVCRPMFEGIGRGRPGLVMAALRYGVLTAPCAWLGMRGAAALGKPALHGALMGLLVSAAVSSLVFLVWLDRDLTRMTRAS